MEKTKNIGTERLIEQLEREVERVRYLAQKENKKTGFCIGNTAKKIKDDYFFTAIRNTTPCVFGSIIIDKVSIAEDVTRAIDGKVNYIFVDTEKKISPELYGFGDVGNVERAVRNITRKSALFTFKGNDLTVDAIDCFLAQLFNSDIHGIGGKKTAIIGAGNIGFKIALKLVERGCHVGMLRRNTEVLKTIVSALNAIKPRGTIAKIVSLQDLKSSVANADIVVGLTPGTQDITAEIISQAKPDAVLIDVGKGSFSLEAVKEAKRRGIKIYRASIESSFEGVVAMLLKSSEIANSRFGRRVIENVPVVSGGLMGEEGEIVVDNVSDPTQIYGVADGCGDFNLSPSEKDKQNIRALRDYIARTKEKQTANKS